MILTSFQGQRRTKLHVYEIFAKNEISNEPFVFIATKLAIIYRKEDSKSLLNFLLPRSYFQGQKPTYRCYISSKNEVFL